jgi:hypothetical protein
VTAALGITPSAGVRSEVLFQGNTVGAYDGLLGDTQDSQGEAVVVKDNKLTNCRVRLTYGTGRPKIVTENVMVPAWYPVLRRDMIDVSNFLDHGVVQGNTIEYRLEPRLGPGGTAGDQRLHARSRRARWTPRWRGTRSPEQRCTVAEGIMTNLSNTEASSPWASLLDNVPQACRQFARRWSPDHQRLQCVQHHRAPSRQLRGVPGERCHAVPGANHRRSHLTHGATLASLTVNLPTDPADGTRIDFYSRRR